MTRRCSRWLLVGVGLVLAVGLVSGCAPEPVVQEEFPDPHPWFSVDSVEIADSGSVSVQGFVLPEAAGDASDRPYAQSPSGAQSADATGAADPGAFPEHIGYGFWPGPDEVGVGETIDVSTDGSFTFRYDLSRPEGVRAGWHVLQFDKDGWGSQMIWVNVRAQEWSETPPR